MMSHSIWRATKPGDLAKEIRKKQATGKSGGFFYCVFGNFEGYYMVKASYFSDKKSSIQRLILPIFRRIRSYAYDSWRVEGDC